MPTSESPGWEAITSHLETVYGDQKPLHWATVFKAMLGGPDPIDGKACLKRL